MSQGEPLPEPPSSSSNSELEDFEGWSSLKRPRVREADDATEGLSPGGEVPKSDMIVVRSQSDDGYDDYGIKWRSIVSFFSLIVLIAPAAWMEWAENDRGQSAEQGAGKRRYGAVADDDLRDAGPTLRA